MCANVTVKMSRSTFTTLRRRAVSSGHTIEDQLKNALRAGRLILIQEQTQESTRFLHDRVHYMKQAIPQLISQISWLTEVVEQAEKDHASLERILFGGN